MKTVDIENLRDEADNARHEKRMAILEMEEKERRQGLI